MTTTVAILTADQAAGERLRDTLQSFDSPLVMRMVRDEPDLSFRSLRVSDAVICASDVPREGVVRLMRGLEATGGTVRVIRIVSPLDQHEEVVESLGLGVRAVVQESSIETGIVTAVREVARGRLYLSPGFIPLVLERYRELCAELRQARNAARLGAVGFFKSFSH